MEFKNNPSYLKILIGGMLDYKLIICSIQKLKGNARLEYFNDEDGVIFGRFDNLGANILGYSLGIDVDLYKGLMWRTEFRGLNSTENIFTDRKSESYDKSYTVSTAIGWKF
ncbi:Uncharacterised protein [Sphingobacterium daejeonense]|nr:outer membrane beta-barrel protein [Sphingobacterium daejeonense]VTP97228.1 Uncharacterised protein [Sphingobacterium daejeonense]